MVVKCNFFKIIYKRHKRRKDNKKYKLLDCELYHFTLKPIGDEEDTLKSFMTFDITPRRPVRSQIVVFLTIPPSQ